MKELFGLRVRTTFVLALVLAVSAGIAAQQQPQKKTSGAQTDVPPPPRRLESELARANYDRVAASAPQIKEVLLRDPGLLVELKTWIAKEASDNGQFVSDDELTDVAVFDRLTRDVKFRAVATRLVQRYGYLKPMVNPESEMGKQQDLLLKERVRRLEQIEAQEDAEALKPPRAETGAAAQSALERMRRYCEEFDDPDCENRDLLQPGGNFTSPGYNGPQRETLPANPQDSLPLSAAAPILQAEAGLGGPEMTGGGGPGASGMSGMSGLSALGGTGSLNGPSDSGVTLQGVSSVTDQSGGASMRGSLPSEAMGGSATLEALRSGAAAELMNNQLSESATTSGNGPEPSLGTDIRRPSRLAKSRDVAAATMVRRPSPYADIPSLYDLYVQAPSLDRAPQRFGTAVFHDGIRNRRNLPMDLPVGPDYVVGPGDSLAIDLWGGISTKLVRMVDRQGRVNLPEAGPLEVSGRTLGEVQQAVQKAITTQYRDTSADVSVARLRTVRIYVVGEVEEPGAYDISSLSTPLNALVAAGGVTGKGSLRALKHFRGRQELERIDTYDLLLRGVTPDAKKLENGDTLMVPPIGPQVTVTGMVRRPAIYELNDEKTLADVVGLAGGILPAAALRHVEVQRLEAHEKRTMLSLDLSPDSTTAPQLSTFKIQDGDEIHIFPIAQYNQDTIYLQGHVLRPGRYSYHEGMKLTDILQSYNEILPEPAAHYGEIIRLNPPDFRPSVVSFDLAAAMKDASAAPKLEPLDTVRIFSRFDFEPIPTVTVDGEVRSPGTYKTSGQATLKDAVYLAGGLSTEAALDTAQVFRVNLDGTSKIFSVNLGEALNGNAADNILLQPRDRLLIHRHTSLVEPSIVEITGEVAKPGRYPYMENMHVEDLIRAAGGLKRSADSNLADLTRYAAAGGPAEQLQVSLTSLRNGNASEDLPLRAGDVLAIRQVPGWKDIGAAVIVRGEVMHPSTYGIQPGERLSSVLERAGGFAKEAYPYGTVLMRRDVRELESKNRLELIERVKEERVHIKALPEGDKDQTQAKSTALAQVDATLTQLASNEPIGRVVIHISSNVKDWKNTAADIPLREGDELVVPKKPSVVIVNGQVFNPTAINAQPGRSAKWYLSQAGGLTPVADKKAVFVIRADGSIISAKNNSSGWWSGDPLDASLRPGDTVVVPEKAPKITGVNWTAIMQTAQVASSVALAVAYIHP
jgi:protein involved in polysaccharide export with SLBB domain